MYDPSGGAPNRTFGFRSQAASLVPQPEILAPVTVVGTALADRAAPSLVLRRNGVVFGPSTAAHGMGNFGAYPAYIGMRAGVFSPFNGSLFGLVIRFGPILSADEIARAEAYLAVKSGVAP